MGAITSQPEHDADVKELRSIVELCPVIPRWLSHHIRNSLQTILLNAELVMEQIKSGEHEALQNSCHRIKSAAEHIADDLKEVGL